MKEMFIFTAQQDLSEGSLTHDVVIGIDTPGSRMEYDIDLVGLAADSDISQTHTVTIISVSGAAYTFDLATATLSTADSSVLSAAQGFRVKAGDTIRVTCGNSGTPAITVSSEIRIKPVG